MYPYIDPQAFANEQAMLQQRINQLEQARNQQMSMYAPQSQQQQQAPTSNVNWIQVAGIEGARNQAQMAQCCCDIKESILADGNATRQMMQENTIQTLRDKLADRDRDLQNAYNQISQVSQTRTIIDAIRPTPTPAYLTCSPYFAYNMTGYGGCCGNGGNVL